MSATGRRAERDGERDDHRHLSTAYCVPASDAHYLFASRVATAFWGTVACVVAHFAVQLGSLIEVVNRFGSIFYGSLLGVFVLALGFRRANGTGAFVGLIAGIVTVAGLRVPSAHARTSPTSGTTRWAFSWSWSWAWR